jgi:hypothetical protein
MCVSKRASARGAPVRDLAVVAAAVAMWWLASPAHARPIGAGDPTLAPRPRAALVWEPPGPTAAAEVNSHLIYLNRCTGGCAVALGATDATADPARSSLGHGVLSAFSQGDATWRAVVACMKDVYAPFDVEVTERDPGAQPHFEIMFGGRPQQLGLAAGIGGVSPFSCARYIANSLVFVFDVWGDTPEEICSTGAQELAHSFALDHTTEPSDPMTYFSFTGRRRFINSQLQCGSDCDASRRSPLGAACSGPASQSHACACGNGAQTQNAFQVIGALFGGGGAAPPVVTITEPGVGDTVAPGFAVAAEIAGAGLIASAELRVDGALIGVVTAAPYAFTGPAELADGTHTIEVTGYDAAGGAGRSRVQVIVGAGCKAAPDCPRDRDACIGGRCVAGPGAPGGLGEVCTASADCASWLCASADGATSCAEVCKPGHCPSGFGCRTDGRGGGVCWAGVDDHGAGCAAAGSEPVGGPVILGWLAARWRRRRRRSRCARGSTRASPQGLAQQVGPQRSLAQRGDRPSTAAPRGQPSPASPHTASSRVRRNAGAVDRRSSLPV